MRKRPNAIMHMLKRVLFNGLAVSMLLIVATILVSIVVTIFFIRPFIFPQEFFATLLPICLAEFVFGIGVGLVFGMLNGILLWWLTGKTFILPELEEMRWQGRVIYPAVVLFTLFVGLILPILLIEPGLPTLFLTIPIALILVPASINDTNLYLFRLHEWSQQFEKPKRKRKAKNDDLISERLFDSHHSGAIFVGNSDKHLKTESKQP